MKSYDFEGPCSEKLLKDFEEDVYIRLSRDFLNENNYGNVPMCRGDTSFLYEVVHGDGSPYETEIERKGHVLIRNGKVIDFRSYGIGPGPIEEIVNVSARLRAENIAKNIEYLIRQGMKGSA